MKKSTVSIPFDDEKLSAVRIYMDKKGTGLDEELAAQLDRLYEKFVPANVRSFISERYNDEIPSIKKREDKNNE